MGAWKPARGCRVSGCPNMAVKGGAYCELHRRESADEYNRFRRSQETAARYGTQWKHVRAEYVKLHPVCEDCLLEWERGELTADRIMPVEEVHHVLPLDKGGTHDFENLRSLCKAHHSRYTLAESSQEKKKTVYSY